LHDKYGRRIQCRTPTSSGLEVKRAPAAQQLANSPLGHDRSGPATQASAIVYAGRRRPQGDVVRRALPDVRSSGPRQELAEGVTGTSDPGVVEAARGGGGEPIMAALAGLLAQGQVTMLLSAHSVLSAGKTDIWHAPPPPGAHHDQNLSRLFPENRKASSLSQLNLIRHYRPTYPDTPEALILHARLCNWALRSPIELRNSWGALPGCRLYGMILRLALAGSVRQLALILLPLRSVDPPRSLTLDAL